MGDRRLVAVRLTSSSATRENRLSVRLLSTMAMRSWSDTSIVILRPSLLVKEKVSLWPT